MEVNSMPQPGVGTDQVPFYTGTQRPLLKHDTPKSPHREHSGGTAGFTPSGENVSSAEIAQFVRQSSAVGDSASKIAGRIAEVTGMSPEDAEDLAVQTMLMTERQEEANLPPSTEEGQQRRLDYYTEQTLADPEKYGEQTEEEARQGVVEGQGLHSPNEIYTGHSGYQPYKRGQTTLSSMFAHLSKKAIGEQHPLLEKDCGPGHEGPPVEDED